MVAKKMYFMDCHLAGRKYHDADEVWEQLKVGTVLKLERDKENRTDANAVMVVYQDKDGEEFKLGYIPRGENETIASLLEMGWTDIFECRISQLDPDAHPENQVHLTIRIVRNKNNEKEA
ncbi:MAG: HIRAN domain-containing protein [Prevotella sp.]|nr:HIRAN domain-containing protein [Prevotella sp.]